MCFFAGKDVAVLVWLDIIALGRYTVFIAAGSCEGVGAPNLVFIGLNCASGGARTVWGSCAFLILGGICMKTLYFDCGMGAAGDMLSAALLELFDDKQAVLDELNALGIPGVEFKAEVSTKCGINGTHFSVTVNGEE